MPFTQNQADLCHSFSYTVRDRVMAILHMIRSIYSTLLSLSKVNTVLHRVNTLHKNIVYLVDIHTYKIISWPFGLLATTKLFGTYIWLDYSASRSFASTMKTDPIAPPYSENLLLYLNSENPLYWKHQDNIIRIYPLNFMVDTSTRAYYRTIPSSVWKDTTNDSSNKFKVFPPLLCESISNDWSNFKGFPPRLRFSRLDQGDKILPAPYMLVTFRDRSRGEVGSVFDAGPTDGVSAPDGVFGLRELELFDVGEGVGCWGRLEFQEIDERERRVLVVFHSIAIHFSASSSYLLALEGKVGEVVGKSAGVEGSSPEQLDLGTVQFAINCGHGSSLIWTVTHQKFCQEVYLDGVTYRSVSGEQRSRW